MAILKIMEVMGGQVGPKSMASNVQRPLHYKSGERNIWCFKTGQVLQSRKISWKQCLWRNRRFTLCTRHGWLVYVYIFYKKSKIKTSNEFFSKQHFCKRCGWFKKFYRTDCCYFFKKILKIIFEFFLFLKKKVVKSRLIHQSKDRKLSVKISVNLR